MVGQYILDDEGQPVPVDDLMTWGEWMQNGNRVVEQTVVGEFRVSTVFLGLDHAFGDEGKPVLWETMIFRAGKGVDQARYTSRADAIAGHAVMVERWAARTSAS